MVRCCLCCSVRGSDSSVFEGPCWAKEGLLEALMSWAVALPLTGNDLPTSILFFLGREVLGGCPEGLLPPLVDGFLQRKEVWNMEKLSDQPASDYIFQEKKRNYKSFNRASKGILLVCASKESIWGPGGRKLDDCTGFNGPAVLGISKTSENSA